MKTRLVSLILAITLGGVAAPTFAAPAAPNWTANAVIYEVNVRQFTQEGTFAAFQTHLPRLKALGVDILWLMPIHPISKEKRKGTLGSPYAVADYKAINPDYGTAADFRSLVSAAHAQGMYIVLDWVANHTGWDHPWLANPDWYTRDPDGRIIHPEGTDWTDVADLNYANPAMRAAMVDAMRYWVTEFDIDGFRADVAGAVPTDFWDAATKQINAIKPLFMLAEDNGKPELMRNSFVANYGWSFKDFANTVGRKFGSKNDFVGYLMMQEDWYPKGTYPMNFITNHDENSWNGTEFKRLGPAVQQMAALSFVIPGMPLIYTGQEIGLDRQLAFFEKDLLTWTDSKWTPFYQKLIRLKKKNRALWNGSWGGPATDLTTSSDSVIALSRTLGKNTVIYVANISPKPVKATISTAAASGTYYAFSTNKRTSVPKKLITTLAPWEWRIYSSTPA